VLKLASVCHGIPYSHHRVRGTAVPPVDHPVGLRCIRWT
jgi:ribosomal protein L2